jgi:hypothetical protein
MKIIEALKQIKDLQRKAEDLRDKVKEHCAISSVETSKYPDQTKQVREWIQAHTDIVAEILKLKTAIQRTNLAVPVTIEIGGNSITKSISEWVIRRRDLAKLDLAMWNCLTDRNIREGVVTAPSGDKVALTIKRFYDPQEKDKMREVYTNEPVLIDSKLEIVNAVTEVIE